MDNIPNLRGGSSGSNAAHPHILILAQAGKLEYEALIFALSLREMSPNWSGRLIIAEPAPEGAWSGRETQISDNIRAALTELGAEITPFTAHHFGHAYPHGNKIEALSTLPAHEPFVFFDTDTLITGDLTAIDFDFNRPSASMRREATWPNPPPYGPDIGEIWKSLYERFGLDYDTSLDLSHADAHWEQYLYFNAGWFFGADPAEFGRWMLDWALAIRNDPGDALASQKLYPWLDQITLPLVIHSLGGGRPGPELDGLDGDVTCHYRNLPMLYTRESDLAVEVMERITAPNRVKKILRDWKPAKKLIYQRKGQQKLRNLMDRDFLPTRDQIIRQTIKKEGWWLV